MGLETGCLPLYRARWNRGLAAVLVNVTVSLILFPFAFVGFQKHLSRTNLTRLVICLAGAATLNWQRQIGVAQYARTP